MPDDDIYEVFAIRYATHMRTASHNFLGGDPHDGPMPLDYFVWLARGATRSYVIDTGFNAGMARLRKREYLRCPSEGLRALGVPPESVTDVILTHLHYDHAGNYDLFPTARFHLQDREIAYATGRCMCHRHLREPYEVEHVLGIVRHVYGERVCFHDGDARLAPGISVHRVGGHSLGLQCVRVRTARGWVVLASDASHLYANLEQRRPFRSVVRVDEMLEGYRLLGELADTPAHIIPGHDPEVMQRYPAPAAALKGVCVCLHASPGA